MKFLSIRDGHDCNISYSDGNKVRYLKFERNYQKKHYNWGHESGDQMEFLLKEAQRIWAIDFSDLDGIALVNDHAHHKRGRREHRQHHRDRSVHAGADGEAAHPGGDIHAGVSLLSRHARPPQGHPNETTHGGKPFGAPP